MTENKYIKFALHIVGILLVISMLALFTGCFEFGEGNVTDRSNESENNADDNEATSGDTTPDETTPPETTPPKPVSDKQLTVFTIEKSCNSGIYQDIYGEIGDNTVTLTFDSPTDYEALEKIYVLTACDDGAEIVFPDELVDNFGKFNLVSEDGSYLTVVDDEGLERRYDIIVDYISTGLPVVSIMTYEANEITSDEEYIDATIRIDCRGVEGDFLPNGFSSLENTKIQISGRGNSTWQWKKKPYKFKFDEKTSVLGMNAAKKWTLLANYSDYSLIRNYVALDAAKVLDNLIYTSSQYPVNFYLNGQYVGVYTIGEQLEVKSNRIVLGENTGETETDLLLQVGGTTSSDKWDVTCFRTDLVRYCKIEYPEDVTKEQVKAVKQFTLDADEAVKNLDGYEEYLDLDSVIDWFIAEELFYNLDSMFRRSCFLTKKANGKLSLGPLWDFDLAFGNLYNDFEEYERWSCTCQDHEYIKDNWFVYLTTDYSFMQKVKARFDEIGYALLQRTLYDIDHVGEIVSTSAKYNFEVWDTLGKRVLVAQPLYITDYDTYEMQIEFLHDFVQDRWDWMNSELSQYVE